MMTKPIVIVAGTLARGEALRKELGVDAELWSTHGGHCDAARGRTGIKTVIVDGSSDWSGDIQATLKPTGARIYWIEPVLL
jgi:hypothetical protein